MLLALMMSIAVQGVVVNPDGSPLPGVTVTLVQGATRATAVTDADGRFVFPSASPSRYRLEAQLSPLETVKIRKSRGSVTITMAPITIADPMPVLLIDPPSGLTLSSWTLSKLPF